MSLIVEVVVSDQPGIVNAGAAAKWLLSGALLKGTVLIDALLIGPALPCWYRLSFCCGEGWGVAEMVLTELD